MKLQELKQGTYQCWQELVELNSAVVQPETFKAEVRQLYGDLRKKSTWQQAYAAFFARMNWDACLSAHTLIVHVLNPAPDEATYELRHLVLEQLLAIPEALEAIVQGLEEIFRSPSAQEKQCAHEVLEMVGRQSGGRGCIAAGSLRQLAGVDPTAAS